MFEFDNATREKIESIFQQLLQNNPLITSVRESNLSYHTKFSRAYSPSNTSVYCNGCTPRTKEDLGHGEKVPDIEHSFYYGAYKDERLKDDDFVCFSRCGNSEFPKCKQDGRIDIRFLDLKRKCKKQTQLEKYVEHRPLTLMVLDFANLEEVEEKNKKENAKSKRLYKVLFQNFLFPAKRQLISQKQKISIKIT